MHFVFLILLVSACSATQNVESESMHKVYSDNTEKEFLSIEKNDRDKIDPSKLSPTSKLSSKNKDRLLEINQNLAFFCMKHRKDPVLFNEKKCQTFTKKVLDSCQKMHPLVNTVMVNCIKARLKKKRH